jgi:hypothetical protein
MLWCSMRGKVKLKGKGAIQDDVTATRSRFRDARDISPLMLEILGMPLQRQELRPIDYSGLKRSSRNKNKDI